MSSETQSQAETVSDNILSANKDGDHQKDIPLVFFRESSLFGNVRPDYTRFIKHEEMFKAVGNVIDPSHITGLQRVNGMWRIYIDNLTDKATLITRGVTLRGKTLPILQSNPMRPDYENTVRVRIQNIPLSVDDGIITRKLVLQGLDVISSFREKLRINSKLTNCETGDRIATVKTSSLKEPLPRFMQFGQFKAKVIHRGQKKTFLKCTKCLESGHTMSSCPNDWKCLQCNKLGHKKEECVLLNELANESPSDASDTESSESSDDEQDKSPREPQGHDSDKSALHGHSSHGKDTKSKGKSTRRSSRGSKSKKHEKRHNAGRTHKQTDINQFLITAAQDTSTPERSRSRSIVRSPPTPAEELCDKSKKIKKK